MVQSACGNPAFPRADQARSDYRAEIVPRREADKNQILLLDAIRIPNYNDIWTSQVSRSATQPTCLRPWHLPFYNGRDWTTTQRNGWSACTARNFLTRT